jgi:hypothetical protein
MNVEVEVFSAVVGLLVHKTIAATWFNKICREKNLKLNYINIRINGLKNQPRLRTLPPPHSYGNQRLQRQFDKLLMMGVVLPETC